MSEFIDCVLLKFPSLYFIIIKIINKECLLLSLKLTFSSLNIINMAFLRVRGARPRRPRIFLPRLDLNDIDDSDFLSNYRLSRDMITDIAAGFEESDFSNKTKKSHSLTAEQQVNLVNKLLCHCSMSTQFKHFPPKWWWREHTPKTFTTFKRRTAPRILQKSFAH